MKIIPAIDLIGGKTVRLEQGKYDKKLSYCTDPVDAAKKWEALGAKLIHVIDLDGAKEGRPVNLSTIKKIVGAVNTRIEVGGGYRSEADITTALEAGAWRVILGSRVLEDLEFTKKAVKNFKENVILSLDAENKKLKARGWVKEVDINIFDLLDKLSSFGVKEIIYTDISRDGTLSGPNVEVLSEILDKTDIKIISAGGVKNIEDIKKLKKLEKKGLSGVIIGRALYDGTIKLEEAINACKADNSLS